MKRALIPAAIAALVLSTPVTLTAQDVQKPVAGKPAAGKPAGGMIDGGKRHAPVAWDGAGPGGHHREGVLRFKPASPRPQAVELRITRPGESAPRSFRWVLQ